jgi:hypothetical protein
LGKIESDWKRDKDGIVIEVTVPQGAKASVVLPGEKSQSVGAGVHRFRVKDGPAS